jgi:hypothetical protein
MWGSPTAIETNAGINILNAGLQASNGTMWLAWQTNRYRGNSFYDISYKTNTNGVWSSTARLTTGGANAGAALAQLSDGTILLFWAYKTAASYLIYYKMYNPGGWSDPIPATSTTLNDTNPSAAVGRDGTLWLVWTRTDATCSPTCTNIDKQLYYKTLKAGAWSSETKLTSDTSQNWGSGVAVGKDGIVRVTWSKGLGSLENYQIYYKTYNGTLWSAETRVVSSTSSDEHPAIMQDRNGTMWLFWQRKIYYTSLLFYYVISSKSSYNSGTTWSLESQLTNTSTSVDSMQPYAVQSTYNKSIWLYYTTNPFSGEDIYALVSSPIQPVHAVTVLSFNPINSPSNSLQYTGGFKMIGQSPILTLNVTIGDPGDYTEIIRVTLTVFNTTSYTLGPMASVVSPGGVANLLFKWDTTGVKPALYGFIITMSPIAGESLGNSADNSLSGKNVFRILPIGDVDQDGWISIIDAGIFFYNFNFTCATPTRFNPLADPDNDCIIGIVDVGIVEINFGLVT